MMQAAKLGNAQAYYNLCCLFSLLGDYEKAMHFIRKADLFAALPPLEEIQADEWLDGLRDTSAFQEFVLALEQRPNLKEEREA